MVDISLHDLDNLSKLMVNTEINSLGLKESSKNSIFFKFQ